jgi:hypothetical protein
VRKRWRIVKDNFAGFEVQSWRWWWPFWLQGRTNTHASVEEAEKYAEGLSQQGRVVKYITPTEATP